MKKFISFSLLLILFLGCTETPIMIPEFEVPVTNRVVLIEDLTGVQCPNCPKGAAALESILKKLEGKVAAVGVHGTFLTKPLPESKYDFRSPKSIALEEYLKPFLGKPAAQINRRWFDGQDSRSVDAVELWLSFIEQELQREQEMEIELKTNYDEATRKLDITMKAISLINENKEDDGPFNVSVYITESKIEDPQENQGVIIEEYEHNHVLRDMLTDAKGDQVATKLTKNQVIQKSYSYFIPANFKKENMEVVVMVSRNKGDDRSVLQAQFIKLK